MLICTIDFWTSEVTSFFDPETGVDVDGIWIDMNDVSIDPNVSYEWLVNDLQTASQLLPMALSEPSRVRSDTRTASACTAAAIILAGASRLSK